MSSAWIVEALRTAVVPRNGAFRLRGVGGLGGPLIESLRSRLALDPALRCEVILGNALYGGGNPARIVALAGGLDERTPAVTLDTQCCSGLDAISFGAARIAAGTADVVFAGGIESWSRSPLRFTRPVSPDETPQAYERPPFTPWPNRDPDLIASAAWLAEQRRFHRTDQEEFAIESHRKALASDIAAELVHLDGVSADPFTRTLSPTLCTRLPVVAGKFPYELTSATVAVQADAASIVVLASEAAMKKLTSGHRPVRVSGTMAAGFDPAMPALAPSVVAERLLSELGWDAGELGAVEIMEAFAVQAMAFIETLKLDPACVNRSGGALARGHPIGASGAVLATRLFHELQRERPGTRGLVAIAAAGGLGTALALND